jgi:hypothetical protein
MEGYVEEQKQYENAEKIKAEDKSYE